MNHEPITSFKQPMLPNVVAPPKENGIGLAGFIVSIVGLFFCGLPSIIAVLISMIGLAKQPRGFATAGLILGVVGILELLTVCVLAFSAYQVSVAASNYAQEFPIKFQLSIEAGTIGNEWEKLSRVPTQEEGESLLRGKRDLMGNQLVYQTDGSSFSLRTAGADGTLQTADDIVAGPFQDIESTRQFEPTELDWSQEGFDPASIEQLLEQDLQRD